MATKKKAKAQPETSKSVKIQMVLNKEVYDLVAELADADSRSISGYCAIVVTKHAEEMSEGKLSVNKLPTIPRRKPKQ